MVNALIYVRELTAGTPTLSQQGEATYAFARANRMRVHTNFRDAGDREIRQRSGLISAIETALMFNSVYIIAYSPRVLDKDPAVAEAVVANLARHEISVRFVHENDHCTERVSGDLRAILRAAADRAIDVNKMILPIKLHVARRLKGTPPGPEPFGSWSWERATVERIRQLRRKPRNQPRRSWWDIASILNQENHRPRKARRWSAGMVRRIALRENR